MATEDAGRILDDSARLRDALQELADHFGDDLILRITLRTGLIHKQFESNAALDIHRLELYHLQFTETIIALLQKLRLGNENAARLEQEELRLNTDLLDKLQREHAAEEAFAAAALAQTAHVGNAILGLYENLSGHNPDNPFSPDIDRFAKQWAAARFHPVTEEVFEAITRFAPGEEYRNSYGAIDKKVLGLQCRQNFRNAFVCGLRSGEDTVEVYRVDGTDMHFVFYPQRRFFNDLSPEIALTILPEQQPSRRAALIDELKIRNLRIRETDTLRRIPGETRALLASYLERITAMDFADATEFDVQAAVLRAMLQTEGL